MSAAVTGSDGAVQLRGITKSYGQVLAVDALDLTVRRGEFLTLLGPSGCGKTTTLRIIGGFEFPDRGSAGVLGLDVTYLPPFKRPVNTVFQNYALFPHRSVAENIGYGLKAMGMSRADQASRVAEMLRLVQLEGTEHRRPRELSGGQQQRVALARAIAPKPEVLLLDEPLGSLDYKLRKLMQVELKEIHRKLGTTFVYVTHDQEEAMAMSDRICVMRAGKVVQEGTPTQIYDRPASRYVADFVGNMNFLPAALLAMSDPAEACVQGLGQFTLGQINDAQPGPVTVGIRHEDVQVRGGAAADRSPAPANSFRAKCVAALPIGSVTRLIIEASNGVRLMADVQRDGANLYEGNDVEVTLPSARLCAFAEDRS